jgi:hypothetical protein
MDLEDCNDCILNCVNGCFILLNDEQNGNRMADRHTMLRLVQSECECAAARMMRCAGVLRTATFVTRHAMKDTVTGHAS